MNASLAAEVARALQVQVSSFTKISATIFAVGDAFDGVADYNKDWWCLDNPDAVECAWIAKDGTITIAPAFKQRYILDKLTL